MRKAVLIFFTFVLLALFSQASFAWSFKQAPLMTQWAALVDTNAPLPEYPRPQMVRTNWLNLNGLWQFQPGLTNDPVPTGQTLTNEILVPYPMESAISGVMQYYEFSWYRRTFTVPPAWSGQRIILHLDAVDWRSQVFVNGQSVGTHKGGYDPITYDITPYLSGSGAQELIVQVYNPVDNGGQPRGKQTLYPSGIMYTSASGIWQPAWLEPVDASGIGNLQIVPDVDNSRLRLTVNTYSTNAVTVYATALTNGVVINTVSGAADMELDIPIPNPTLWTPDNPFLYDLQIIVTHNGVTNDTVTSYFGMRKISVGMVDGAPKILLNNQFLFGMGPLDQGYWPDGIYTAPTDAALSYDLQEEKTLGYNLIRKHEKVERARWYYWADKLGLMVWQDMPTCNSYTSNPNPPAVDPLQFIAELTAMVTNHWNSPAIVMWDVFNEGQGEAGSANGVGQTNTAYLVQLVKTLDPSHLVNQASGGSYFGVGDVLDEHSYPSPGAPSSTNQAMTCGEYGAIDLTITNHIWTNNEGGAVVVTDETDCVNLYDSYSDVVVWLRTNEKLSAAIYTQITDVEGELDGLLTYDRAVVKGNVPAFAASNVKAINELMTLSTILPSSQTQAQTWKYITATPASNWYATNFNDSSWSSGPGGFGTAGTPNAVIGTTWNTSDIWLRQEFYLGSLSASESNNLTFYVYHDEDCQIYLNGVEAGSASGYFPGYTVLQFTQAGKSALLQNATNLIAVHCDNTAGGQDIDAGISVMDFQSVTPTAPPPTPAGLSATPGDGQVSLSWLPSTGASSYILQRSGNGVSGFTTITANLFNNNYTDTSVTNGVTYYYEVSATNSLGGSTNSPAVSATPSLDVALVAWFRADAISGVNNNSALATWTDSSGNGNNATQSTALFRPNYVTNAMNGLPVVRFNSANSNYLSLNRVVQDDFTIVCVFQSTQGVGTGTAFFSGAGLVNAEVAGVTDDFGTSLNANGQILAGTGEPDTTEVSGTGYNNGKPHVFTFKRVESTGRITLYVDGLQVATGAAGTESLTAPGRIVLGAQQTILNFLTGDIAEVKIYNTPISDSSRVEEENALAAKYGIPVPKPSLGATLNNNSLQCIWPAWASGYTLWSATNLTQPVSWTPVTNPPQASAENLLVTLPAIGQNQFFKLSTM